MFVKTKVKKWLFTHKLPSLCMVIENKFSHHKIGDRNQIWSTIRLATNFSTFLSLNWVTKKFRLSYMMIEFFLYAQKHICGLPEKKKSSNQYWPLIQQLKNLLSLPKKIRSMLNFFRQCSKILIVNMSNQKFSVTKLRK